MLALLALSAPLAVRAGQPSKPALALSAPLTGWAGRTSGASLAPLSGRSRVAARARQPLRALLSALAALSSLAALSRRADLSISADRAGRAGRPLKSPLTRRALRPLRADKTLFALRALNALHPNWTRLSALAFFWLALGQNFNLFEERFYLRVLPLKLRLERRDNTRDMPLYRVDDFHAEYGAVKHGQALRV